LLWGQDERTDVIAIALQVTKEQIGLHVKRSEFIIKTIENAQIFKGRDIQRSEATVVASEVLQIYVLRNVNRCEVLVLLAI
jgi:hypothetical protein